MMEADHSHRTFTHETPERVWGIRGLVLGWCLWLLGSWGATLAVEATVPAARWMVFAAAVGLMLAWPALRLSTGGGGVSGGHHKVGQVVGATLLEWFCLNGVFQAVVWPLRLIAGWSLGQAAWIAGALAVWSALTGVAIAWGRTDGWLARSVAMLLAAMLLLGEPLLMGLANLAPPTPGAWDMRLSPVQTLWTLTASSQLYEAGRGHATLWTIAAAAGLGWIVLIVWGLIVRLSPWPGGRERPGGGS